jgi:hypothetical protein
LQEETAIQVKASYIHIDFFIRFISGALVFFASFTLLVIFIALSFKWVAPLFFFELGLSLALSAAGGIFVFSSENILIKLTKKWDYTKFCRLQENFSDALAVSAVSIPTLLLMSWLSPSLRIYLYYLSFGVFLVLFFALPFSSFYTRKGNAILNYSAFIEDFKKNPENADFGQIRSATSAVSKMARNDNMEIDPYCLSLGLSVGFLQDSKGTSADITTLIEWIENPRKDNNFAGFKKTIEKYTKLSTSLSKEGITAIHRLSFEQKLAIWVVAVPSVAAEKRHLELDAARTQTPLSARLLH